jgi:hypothetical protein
MDLSVMILPMMLRVQEETPSLIIPSGYTKNSGIFWLGSSCWFVFEDSPVHTVMWVFLAGFGFVGYFDGERRGW